jgi:uncharacterized protein (DUF4415 family)
MRKQYDFSNARPNPYVAKLKKQITIRLDDNVIDYFKMLAETLDLPYQNLINMYLRDCAIEQKVPRVEWIRSEKKAELNARSRRSD